ncbi:MAG TPA: UDP-N-acetylmuramate dehydrogenase [Polyangia bacterium]
MSFTIVPFAPLAPLTTLGLGGPARFFAEIRDISDVVGALRRAKERELPVFVLGSGSNLVVADEGFPGLVLRMGRRRSSWTRAGSEVRVEVQAGEAWDDVVAAAVRRDAAGIECLSGIPGTAGAAPVQNIGAYGQEVAETIRKVRVLDRDTFTTRDLAPGECGFGYRTSLFKREPDRYVILSTTLRLVAGGRPALRYAELAAAFSGNAEPSLADVRQTVLALRRKKSMVYDEADANRRSAGSFFTNPIVTAELAAEIAHRAVAAGFIQEPAAMPSYVLADGRVKLAAGWLIERAGLAKGFRMGPVGISSQHALALVHHGGGTTADLLRLALHVRGVVFDRFGISLAPEPVFLGLTWP